MYNGKYLDVSHFGDPYERILQWILRFFRYIPTSLKGFLRIARNFHTQHVIFLWYFFLTELEFFFSDLQPIFFKKTSDSRLAWITQLVALAFGAISLAIAFLAEYLGGVLQASLTIFGVVGGPLFGLFTIGMFSTAVEEKVSWWSILFIRSQRSFRFHSDCFVLIKDSWSWIRFSVIKKRKEKKSCCLKAINLKGMTILWKGALFGVLSGLAFSLWIGFGGPKPPIPRLSQKIDGCLASNITDAAFSTAETLLTNLTTISPVELLKSPAMNLTEAATTSQEYFPLYRLSFMWYAPLGFLVTIITAQIVSRFLKALGAKDSPKIDENLLSPIFPDCFRSRDQLLEPVLMVLVFTHLFEWNLTRPFIRLGFAIYRLACRKTSKWMNPTITHSTRKGSNSFLT